jgi:hypothetical protein
MYCSEGCSTRAGKIDTVINEALFGDYTRNTDDETGVQC